MQLFKCSLVFLYTLNLWAFSPQDCLESNFKMSVVHQGWPMGLSRNVLEIEKEKCDIRINHTRLKYIQQQWHIDVCREPVHIKKGRTVEVLKKKTVCKSQSKDKFCQELKNLEDIIQDDGLIFASGVKSDLSSAHGQVYCAYQLIRSYSQYDHILSVGKPFSFSMKKVQKTNEKSSEPSVPFVPRPEIDGQELPPLDENQQEEGKVEDEAVETEKSSTRSF